MFVSVCAVGVLVGVAGRFLVPGRHGLARFLRRDLRRAPRLLTHDDETRWEVGAGVLGAGLGYVLGMVFDAQLALEGSSMRWILTVAVSGVIVAISIASGVIERSRFTRKLEIHS